jgi:arabinose-5-phosphate isomerase
MQDVREIASQVFEIESKAVASLVSSLTEAYNSAIFAILESNGRLINCSMGKSGIIGRKIAATIASTGTLSFFMHPGDAYHRDLGMVSTDDVFIAI